MFTMQARRVALGVWLLAVIVCIVIIARTRLETDMTAFLPRSASLAEQVLTEQVTRGVAARLILLGIEGAPPATLAALSKSLAARLRRQIAFAYVANGDDASLTGTRDYFWRNRYLLSPGVVADRFTIPGLHAALQEDLGLLGSDLGALIKGSLPNDPTGEMLSLSQRLARSPRPRSQDGVWFSAGGRRALLLVYTRAAGFDIDAQQAALAQIHAAFQDSRRTVSGAAAVRLVESGPAVFAVQTRATMKRDATRFSLLATAVVTALLVYAYRSARVLVLSLLPVASGALAAVAAVSLGFGFVHGITLGFGVTLIGESVDYAIYLFTQTMHGDSAAATLARIWPTLRLGALTSIVGFSAMLFSDFVGFAQLGLFSITGLVAAAGVTRFVLPDLTPPDFFATGAGVLARPLLVVMSRRQWLRPAVALLVLAASVVLLAHRGGFWDEDLTKMSPIPAAEQRLDQALRHEAGVPDLRYFVVFRRSGEQVALAESEAAAALLERLVATHTLGGFDVPSEILPSDRTQRKRRATLPDAGELRARFALALAGLPFRPGIFAPFFRDTAATKRARLLTRADLPAPLRLQFDSMLFERDDGWNVVAPLTDVADPKRIVASLAASGQQGLTFVDIHQESDRLLHTYQREATLLASIGSLAIVILLFIGLRAPARVAFVVAPLAASVIVTAALLTLNGGRLSIFMVVGFLLIVAVGSNYCLFFERLYHTPESQRRSVASIVLANLCTVSAYGLMSLSGIPVLHDIGVTVAAGTFLSLIFAAIVSVRVPLERLVGGEAPHSLAGPP